jgi:glutathionyl-hydroquinone reductase
MCDVWQYQRNDKMPNPIKIQRIPCRITVMLVYRQLLLTSLLLIAFLATIKIPAPAVTAAAFQQLQLWYPSDIRTVHHRFTTVHHQQRILAPLNFPWNCGDNRHCSKKWKLLFSFKNNPDQPNELSSERPPAAVQSPSSTSSVDKGFNLLEVASKIVPQGIIVTVVSEMWKLLWTRLMVELAPQSKIGAYVRPSYNFSFSTRPLQQDPTDPPLHDDPLSLLLLSNVDRKYNVLSVESPRYRVYVGNPCPWCHRVLLAIHVLQLQNDIEVVSLQDNPRQASRGGWILKTAPDVNGNMDLRDVYNYYFDCDNVKNPSSQSNYQGRCTAPLLVDMKLRQIISNESSDIVRILISFYERKANQIPISNQEQIPISNEERVRPIVHLLPDDLRAEIDDMNDWIYHLLNNGVYRCGFATTQLAYNMACDDVRKGLQRCEEQLQQTQAYMGGTNFTEADLRLLPTLLRFDGVYGPFFKAGGTHVCIRSDYPAIQQWLYRCWNTIPGVPESINITDACTSYYQQLFPLNPSGIIPYPITAADLGLEERVEIGNEQ